MHAVLSKICAHSRKDAVVIASRCLRADSTWWTSTPSTPTHATTVSSASTTVYNYWHASAILQLYSWKRCGPCRGQWADWYDITIAAFAASLYRNHTLIYLLQHYRPHSWRVLSLRIGVYDCAGSCGNFTVHKCSGCSAVSAYNAIEMHSYSRQRSRRTTNTISKCTCETTAMTRKA
jgi:hypothetical protein